jgi:type VI secretion system secreted protein VgrG
MSVLDLLRSKLVAMDAVLELPVGEARIVGLRVHEGLSRHTAATVELSTDGEFDVEPLLYADAGIVIRKNGLEVRRWTLKVAGGGFTRIDNGAYRYELDLRSAFWFLEHTLDTRKFREVSSRDIIATVLQKDGIAHRFATVRAPDVRKYCVQYRESDRAFVERLLEYEGIFHHTDAAGTLVLRDVSQMSPDIEGDRRVDLIESAGALAQAEVGVHELAIGARTVSGTVSLNDFDWKRPSKNLLSTAASGVRPDLEVYEAPGGYRRGDQGTLLSRMRLEALQALEHTVEGRGNVPSFAAGHVVEIDDRLGEDFAGDKLLVEVEHFYSDNRQGRPRMFGDEKDATWGQDQAADTTIYGNRFVSIPRATPFRPPMKTPVPNLAGCHTAMVRGPTGEEIHTDKYGRFRAQFHWDRDAVSTDEDSRWLRMLQESNSSLFLARVGWEMNVAYIHGDPDRPIGLARDINGVMTPAYSQPGDKNVMTIKTPSSPATGGFNELRLDDSVGTMTMYLQAERDMRTRVKHDLNETVGNNEKHVSGDNFGRSVRRDQTVTVGGNATYVVGDTHGSSVGGNRVVTIGGNEDVVAKQGAGLSTDGNDTENVGSVRLTIDGSVKPPKVISLKDLVPDPKAAAKAAGQAALGALKSGGGLSGAASAAGGSLKKLVPTPEGIAEQIKGSLTLGGIASMICTGTIARTASQNVKRTVGGAYIGLSLGSIETSAGKLFIETIGGAKVTVAKGSIDQGVGKAMALTVGGLIMHTTSDKYGVSGKSGTVLVGGTATMTATEKIEIAAEEVFLTAGAKLTLAGPSGSVELTPASMAFTGDVLLEPGTKLKTTGQPLNLTKAGG